MEQSLEVARYLVQSSAVLDALMEQVRSLREAVRLAEMISTEVSASSGVAASQPPVVEIRT